MITFLTNTLFGSPQEREKKLNEREYLFAAEQGDFDKVQDFIINIHHYNIDLMITNYKRENAIKLAFMNNHTTVGDYLVTQLNKPINKNFAIWLFIRAIEKDYSDTVDYLIQKNLADPNFKLKDFSGKLWMSGSTEMYGYYTPLYLACLCGSYNVVNSLLNAGVRDINEGANYRYSNPGCGDDEGYDGEDNSTPLEVASSKGYNNIIDILLTHDSSLVPPKIYGSKC